MQDPKRPTKKQRELLTFIENFIAGYGYGPSYREIMRGLGYKSVATVALHIDNLISKGLLNKKDYSARSLEVVGQTKEFKQVKVKASEEKWLVEVIEKRFQQVESISTINQESIDELYVLIGALKVLGFEGAANSFITRLTLLKKKIK